MGVSTSGLDFTKKISKLASAIEGAQRDAVADAALVIKRSVEASRDRAVGSDGKMSHVGRSGAKLGVGFEMSGGVRNPKAVGSSRGPWRLIEENTKAHTIGGRKRTKKRGGGFGVIAFGSLVRARVHHPGTRGKHPWKLGVAAGWPGAIIALRRANVTVISASLKGAALNSGGSSSSRLKGRSDD